MQDEEFKATQAEYKRMVQPVKGRSRKHQIQWLGHAGFRINLNYSSYDRDVIMYIDPNLNDYEMPTDANIILITHSHYQHMVSALPLAKAAKDPNCKIACSPMIASQLKSTNMIEASKVLTLNIGGSSDLGYARITMVQACHDTGPSFDARFCQQSSQSSTTSLPLPYSGGQATGWVIQIKDGPTIYHSGDTNIFTDMAMFDELYKPTHVIIPVGGQCTMGPYEAAFACKNYLKNCHTVIPMHYKCQNLDIVSVEESIATLVQFRDQLESMGVMDKRIIDQETTLHDKWMDLID